MKYVELGELEAVYACNRDLTVVRTAVKYPELEAFAGELTKFARRLRYVKAEDYRLTFVRSVKRLTFDLCAAPLTNEQLVRRVESTANALEKHLEQYRPGRPGFEERARGIIAGLRALTHTRMAHLYDQFATTFGQSEGDALAVVVKEARHVTETIAALHGRGGFEQWQVVNARELDNVLCFEAIVVIGAARWFPDYLFTAPRAKRIDLLVYDWVSSPWRPSATLMGAAKAAPYSLADKTQVGRRGGGVGDDESGADAAREALVRRADSNGEEEVEARIALLEGDNAVLLDASPEAKTLIIDLRTLANDHVQKIPVKDLEPGTFIVLRTEGGGDYIVSVADGLLGEKAAGLRDMQKHWKDLLRQKVQRSGTDSVVEALRQRGSHTASPANLRNWMSYRSIRTHDRQDFKAIMAVVGLGSQADAYWQAMSEIAAAHHKAGFVIREMILREVEKVDMTALRRLGMMRFEPAEQEGGSMTAFRVLEILPETHSVAAWQLGEPVSLSGLYL